MLGPILWDLVHLAVYEDLWGVGAVAGTDARRFDAAFTARYDAFEQPRPGRAGLELEGLGPALELLERVRARTAEVHLEAESRGLEETSPGFVLQLVHEHETQHAETMLQSLALFGCRPRRWKAPTPTRFGPEDDAERVVFEGGRTEIGCDLEHPFDNEAPRHAIGLAPFAIDRYPVSNRRFERFVRADGYRRRDLWSDAGWSWRTSAGVDGPLGWATDARSWPEVERFGERRPLDPGAPVECISVHEAEAFARFEGGRLPTEFEWEHAARSAPQEAPRRAARTLGCGTLPPRAGDGPQAMFGWVYEWTATEFGGYPGFRPFPYPEYSRVFFDRGYRVLRGCSWAAAPTLARATYRNWDRPERRQLFAGLRLAWEVC